MKYSLIVVNYKSQAAVDRLVASVHKYADMSETEIIVRDNSKDNVGFSQGCNIAAAAAKGDYIVLVNPDVEFMDNPLPRLERYFKHEKVDAVGPVTSFAAGFQNIVRYMGKRASDEEAYRFAKENGKGVETKILIGYFLMIRRALWEEIGGLDPKLFLGCDDLDLSLRLTRMGLRMIVAADVYVKHEGHVTFGKNAASTRLLDETERYYRKKLNAEYPGGVPSSRELWGCDIFYTGDPKRKLSILIIARREEKNLSELLPLLGFADEVVLCDTGLPGEEMQLSVVPPVNVNRCAFPWVDDFSAARNAALAECTGDYVLWLDTDDRVGEESGKLIRAAMNNPGPMTLWNMCHFNFILRDHQRGTVLEASQPRMFPRIEWIKWEGIVHESYMPSVLKMKLQSVTAENIYIDHYGYDNPELNARKQERNLALLSKETDSPGKCFHEAKSLMSLRRFSEADERLKAAMETVWPEDLHRDFRHQLNFYRALCLYQEKGGGCREMLPLLMGNEKPDAMFLLGEACFAIGEKEKAKRYYTGYLSLDIKYDVYGTNKHAFDPVCLTRLKQLEGA